MESIKIDGKYETGQLFLHRIFGYRGVVLFPWSARVYDRDLHNPNKQKQRVNVDRSSTAAIAAEKSTKSTNTEASTEQGNSATHATSGGESPSSSSSTNGSDSSVKEVKGKVHTFYQVLIDSRDCPYIVSKTSNQSITNL